MGGEPNLSVSIACRGAGCLREPTRWLNVVVAGQEKVTAFCDLHNWNDVPDDDE